MELCFSDKVSGVKLYSFFKEYGNKILPELCVTITEPYGLRHPERHVIFSGKKGHTFQINIDTSRKLTFLPISIYSPDPDMGASHPQVDRELFYSEITMLVEGLQLLLPPNIFVKLCLPSYKFDIFTKRAKECLR